jgi:DNA-binding CsgD family transcriptional regulator
MNLDSTRIGQLLTAVDLVYAAALDASQWKPFLGAAAALVKADNAYVSEIAHGDGTLEYVVLNTENWDSVSVGRYAALMNEDPRMPAFRQSPSRPLHCRMVVPESKLRESRVYLEALRPLDIEYTLVVGVPAGHGVTNFLGFTRKAVSPGFDLQDCELVGELVPHLARAFTVHRTLNLKPSLSVPPPAAPWRDEPKEKVLERIFALSPVQARLTALLMAGHTIKEIASILGITEGSARQYLQRIFGKTGAKRQADLVRIVGQALMRYS